MSLLLTALLTGCGVGINLNLDKDEDNDGVTFDLDCDDNDATVKPKADEIQFDGVDQNCNGNEDEDVDGDGQTILEDDCNDDAPYMFTNAFEYADGYDNNCNDEVDEFNYLTTFQTSYFVSDYVSSDLSLVGGDVDNDGYSELAFGLTEASGQNERSGLAYILSGATNPITDEECSLDQAAYSIKGASENDRFGSDMAMGDINGDGLLDIAVGAKGYDAGESATGAVSVYSGEILSQDMLYDQSIITLTGDFAFGYAGASVAFGDVNGDGLDDLFTGAYGVNGSQGVVYLYKGAEAGFYNATLEGVSNVVLEGDFEGDQFGWAVSSGYDVDGDGFEDLLVGAPQYERLSETQNTGAAYLYLGNDTSINEYPASIFLGENAYDNAGYTATLVSDVNNDGYDDILIGAPGVDTLEQDSGMAYLVFGAESFSSEKSLGNADVLISGTTNNQQLGISLAGLGDVDADGYGDIAVSGFRDDDLLGLSAVYLYLGSEHLSDQTSSQANAVFVGDDYDQLLVVNGGGDFTGQYYPAMGPFAEMAIAHTDNMTGETMVSIVPGQKAAIE